MHRHDQFSSVNVVVYVATVPRWVSPAADQPVFSCASVSKYWYLEVRPGSQLMYSTGLTLDMHAIASVRTTKKKRGQKPDSRKFWSGRSDQVQGLVHGAVGKYMPYT